MRFTTIESTPRAKRSVFGLMAAVSLLEADLHAPVEERESAREKGKERRRGGEGRRDALVMI